MLGDPALIALPGKYEKAARAHAETRDIVEKYREYKLILQNTTETKKILEEESEDEFSKNGERGIDPPGRAENRL